MPIIKSAIKRVEITERNRLRNQAWKSAVRTARNKVATLVLKQGDANEALKQAFSLIDQATSKGILHKNTAARRKARLVKLIRKSQKSA